MTSTMELVDAARRAETNQRYAYERSTPREYHDAVALNNEARAALEQRIKELERDVKRYRWLRENHNLWGRIEMGHNGSYPERMDEAIDRAMSEAALTKAVEISQEYKLP